MSTKKRRLSDLYRRGVDVTIDDGSGDPVTVFMQKLSPHDQEIALRKANAARAQMLMDRNNPESERYQAAYTEANDFGDPQTLIEYIAIQTAGKKEEALEAELGAAEEWSKDDYLQGLRDVWTGVVDGEEGLDQRYAEDPEDPEAKRVFNELKRFSDLVTERMEAEIAGARRELEGKSEEEIRHLTAKQFLDDRANAMFMMRYSQAEIFMATRVSKEERRKPYFETLDEVEDLQPEVTAQLARALADITVGITEGKGSAETPPSSPSSSAPEAVETDAVSGLTVVSP